MELGVICAMAEELQTLLTQLTGKQETRVGHQTYYRGTIGKVPVTLVESGVGKVQAAMTTTVLIDRFHADLIINTGSAAGIGKGLKVGDVVIADAVAYHDVDVTPAGYSLGQLPGQPETFPTDVLTAAAISDAASAVGLVNRVGLIVSGDQFISSQTAVDQIREMYPAVLAVEMEGAAVGQVATEFGVPFVVIRAMSDVGDEDAQSSFDAFILQAGRQSAQMLLNYLAGLGA